METPKNTLRKWFGPSKSEIWQQLSAEIAFPDDTDELCFHVSGVIKDIPRLKLLFELFAETLDQLCRIGSACETAPQVRL